ncbi:MAG: glycosyltransferase [Ramlibacter sp.]
METPSPVAGSTADRPAPLVSVLVRSIDRAHLKDALDSVALQTWPNIEVVVIAAKPGHRPLPAKCGPHSLRLVATDAVLHRSKAANRALDEAAGEYLLFLDDDDWLMPGHVARLAEVLQRQPKALAAYTGVSLVNEQGEPTGQVMDLPFDGVRQLAGNLTPIQAVMFHRQLLALGARFDEQLDHYEDWDFWLQVARHTVPVHLPGVSAAYRIHDSSGVHEEPGTGGNAALRVFEKWQSAWRPDQQGKLMQRAWATEDMGKSLQAAKEFIETLHAGLEEHQRVIREQMATIAQQGATLAHQQATLHDQAATVSRLAGQVEAHMATIAARESNIADLMNSTSWKLTAPLRRISRSFKRGA